MSDVNLTHSDAFGTFYEIVFAITLEIHTKRSGPASCKYKPGDLCTIAPAIV